MPHLALLLMGAFEATAAGRSIVSFSTDKSRALMAYLALEADRPHQRLSLAGLLWPDMPDESALNNLRKSLHRLRQTIDPFMPGGSDPLFTVTRQTIQLNLAALSLDVTTFQELLAACESHPHRHLHICQPCLSRLAQAVGLYRGELLAGLSLGDAAAFEEWLLIRREALHHQALVALYQLAAAYEQRGEYEQAHRYAARQVALDPYREEAHQQVVRALALSGQYSEALQHYEALRQLLAQELGVRPQPETIALYEKIKAEARLPGKTEGVVKHSPGYEFERRALVSLHYFPVQFTPFIGREAESLQIQDLLLDPDCRLLTLLGPGGIGKTRLGIRVMEQLAAKTHHLADRLNERSNAPSDGIYFFPLTGVASADLLPTALTNGLGLILRQGEDPQTQLLDYLRDKQIWLVLDNFEHLMDGTQLLLDILVAAPHVRLLVTSRQSLQVRAEWQFPLDGLTYPLSDDTSADVLAYSAVQLFMHMARHFRPGYSPSPTDRAAVIRICRAVQGMPLALEIAASWMRVHDPDRIAAEITRSVNFLTASLRDLPERHRGIGAVFEYSWTLLTGPQQLILAQLSVFRGGFGLEAALAVAQASSQDIAALLDKSLLKRNVEGRYEMHELLRQFTMDKLDALAWPAHVAETTRQRHSDYYLSFVAENEAALYGPEPRSGITAVQHRLDNIRQAWQWALEQNRLEALARSLEGLGRFYDLAGFFAEGVNVMGRAAALLREQLGQTTDADHRLATLASHLLVWQAHFFDQQSEANAAIPPAYQALALAEQVEARQFQAHAHSLLGELLPHHGEFEQAKAYQQQALDYYREAGDARRQANSLSSLGIIHWRSGNYALALACFQQSRPLHQATGNKAGLAKLMNSMAGVYYEQGDLDQSLAYVQQSLDHYQAIGDHVGTANSWGNLALVYRELGKYDLALACNQQDLDSSRERGNRHHIAVVLGNRGAIHEEQGDLDQAQFHTEQALQIEEELGNRWEAARHRASLGAIRRKKGDSHQALVQYDAALPVLRARESLYYVVLPLLGKAEVLYDLLEFDAAREHNQEAFALAVEQGRKDMILRSRILAAKIDFALGRRDNARQQLAKLLAETHDSAAQASLHYELWRMGRDQRHAQAAITLYRQLQRVRPRLEYQVCLDELLAGQAR